MLISIVLELGINSGLSAGLVDDSELLAAAVAAKPLEWYKVRKTNWGEIPVTLSGLCSLPTGGVGVCGCPGPLDNPTVRANTT